MKYQIRSVQHLTDAQLLSKLHLAAKLYSQYADSSLLFIVKEKVRDMVLIKFFS